jgi:hypothetical protein
LAGRDGDAVSRRRLWTRIAVGSTIVVSLAALAFSVDRRLDVRTDQAAAERDIRRSEAEEKELRDRLAALEEAIREAGANESRDRDAADVINGAVADLATMRTRIDEVAAALVELEAERGRRQPQIDLLMSCRSTLDEATANLQGSNASASAAASVLDGGRAQCQQALDVIRGDTSAAHPYDFPDPSVTTFGGTYYAYGTNGSAGTIQTLSSTDLVSWTVLPPAFEAVPRWAQPGRTWAPSVVQIGSAFVLYYTVRVKGTGRQCISRAVATQPTGPFVDSTAGPLVCQTSLGGSIDPSTYQDEFGILHLVWKSEGETVGGRAQIWSQDLTPDGLALAGQPVLLLTADQAWQDRVIENPSMFRLDGAWVLTYSGNRWNTASYATGFAMCAGALGPCTSPAGGVIQRSTATLEGPGGAQHFVSTGGKPMVSYAAWDAGGVGYPNPRRLHIASISLSAYGPVITDL